MMSWSIAAAVTAATALSWLPGEAWVGAAGSAAEVGGCAVAVAAAAWGILSEVRGWEGSDASRWLLKRRVKAFNSALERRRRDVLEALMLVRDDAVIVCRADEGVVVEQAYTPDVVRRVAMEPSGAHLLLRLATRDGGERTFEWLPRDEAFEAAVLRFQDGIATTAPQLA